ncbi:hypothetical protein ACFE04_022500 [Oxalis oulophora]
MKKDESQKLQTMISKAENFVQWPKPIKNASNRTSGPYCDYHRAHGHATNECKQLKDELEFLARKGNIDKYLSQGPRGRTNRRNDEPHTQPRGVINTIVGGLASGGSSNRKRKAYAREVCVVGGQPKANSETYNISFTSKDLENVKTPHDDPLVIQAMVGNFSEKRVFMDNGSSVNILVEGAISLPTTFQDNEKRTTEVIEYLVVKGPSAYNIIFGRTGLHKFKAIPSTYHQKMKFPTTNGVRTIIGDQKIAHNCYLTSLKVIEESQDTSDKNGNPSRGTPSRESLPI